MSHAPRIRHPHLLNHREIMSAKLTPATKTDKRNRLFAECDLVKEDMFEHQHYTILTRSGIEKVQAHYKITVTYKALKLEPQYVVIKATATMGEARVETYGSAVLANCKNSYFAETAEKRALSRAVLKLTGLYQHGFFGEEESEQLTAEAKAAAPAPAPVRPTNELLILALKEGLLNAKSVAALMDIWTSLGVNEQTAIKPEFTAARLRIKENVELGANTPVG